MKANCALHTLFVIKRARYHHVHRHGSVCGGMTSGRSDSVVSSKANIVSCNFPPTSKNDYLVGFYTLRYKKNSDSVITAIHSRSCSLQQRYFVALPDWRSTKCNLDGDFLPLSGTSAIYHKETRFYFPF